MERNIKSLMQADDGPACAIWEGLGLEVFQRI